MSTAAEQATITQASDDVFVDYDIVVSFSQRLINGQLSKLTAAGALPSSLCVSQNVDDKNNFVFTRVNSPSELDPDLPSIAGVFTPQIDITATGTEVNLVLAFESGTASFWVGNGPGARNKVADMSGWRYACSVTLNLAALDSASIGAEPQLIRDQLTAFSAQMFDVSRLFCDLDATQALTFNPEASATPGADPQAISWFGEFMQFYLKSLVVDHNPFVLGYPVTAPVASQATMSGVPDLLQPTGTTFTVYHEPSDPDLSSINYVLVTRGGHRAISGTPPVDRNWLLPERCDVKSVYARDVLVEPLLVAPVFNALRQNVYQEISGQISVGEGNDYNGARHQDASGLQMTVSTISQGDDQYVNQFTVGFGDGSVLPFNGMISVYKEVSQDDFFCTAEAWASAQVNWQGQIALTVAGGVLDSSPSFQIKTKNHDSSTNTCADAFSWIGRILGGILDTFTGWTDGGFLSDTFANAFSVSIPGVGTVDVALDSIGAAARTTIVLPAAGVLTPACVTVDDGGNAELIMNYAA